MDTYPPTDSPESLTTEAVIAGCRAAGFNITKAQLSRWARAGLLEHPQVSGRGRGKGWQWRWKAETLPRARLVTQALSPQESARTRSPRGRSFERAADKLMYKGYAPRSDILSQRLHTFLNGVERDVMHRQAYLADQSLTEQDKRTRFVTAIQRRWGLSGPNGARMADALSVWAAIAVGFTGLARYFSFQAFREALDASDADVLNRAYALATELSIALAPEFDAVVEVLLQSLPPPRDVRRRRPPAVFATVETWREFVRPVCTLALLSFYHHAAEMRAHIMALGPMIANWEQALGVDTVASYEATIEQLQPSWQWLVAPLMAPGTDAPKTDTGTMQPGQVPTMPTSPENAGGETPTT